MGRESREIETGGSRDVVAKQACRKTAGIKLNQNIKIMDRKVLKDKIDELRSTAKMELACTIREIMRERGILSKELKHPVMCSDKIFEAVLIEINDEDTSIPAITLRVMSYKRVAKRVSSTDFEMDFESLASIAYELNNEPES